VLVLVGHLGLASQESIRHRRAQCNMSRRIGKHRIYMNVGYDLSEQQLRDFFNQYGNVTDVYLPKHKSGRNKGFGFTTFDSDDGLRSALSAQEYIIGGDLVKINRAGPRPEHELQREAEEAALDAAESDGASSQPQLFGKGPRLYVGGVPEELTEERLKAHFSRWGNVVDLYFPGKKGQSRVNYCFVTFDNWRAAQRACNQSERNIDGLVSSAGMLLCCSRSACVFVCWHADCEAV
jgi:RNA-binding protein Musashi